VHAAELLGDNARLSAQLIDTDNAALCDLLAVAVSTARPGVEVVEFAELLLALLGSWRPACPIPPHPARRLRDAVALLVAGLNHPQANIQESS
jgi:hypothetical protein